ncbi:MAG: helix-turn-helix domain-containing protein [Bradyrhizobium sp.]
MGNLTPTQRQAIARSRNFREAIAAKAAELAERKAMAALSALRIAAIEAPLTKHPEVKIVVTDLVPEPSTGWSIAVAPEAKPIYPQVRDIQIAVCKHFDVKLLDMLSKRRTAEIVKPRQIAMYLAKTLTLKSLPDIGRRFGGRDHTTALHAIRKMEGLILLDDGLAHDIAILIESITGIQQ